MQKTWQSHRGETEASWEGRYLDSRYLNEDESSHDENETSAAAAGTSTLGG